MKPGSLRSSAALGSVVAGLLANSAVHATELSYGVDVGVGQTDNIARVAEDEQDETIATVGAELRLDHESKRLRANVTTHLEYRDYLDNTYDGEVVGNLLANGVFDVVEDRFSWTVTDTFGQTTQNQFAPATPDNRENVNYLSTGPDFTLPLGSRNTLVAHGRYVDLRYEDSELGNQRTRGELALSRALSAASNLSVNVTTEQTRFDDQADSVDFDNNQAFARYEVNAARTTFSVDGGVNEISRDGDSNRGWLGRVHLTRRASPSLTVGMDLGHEFSDAGNAFANLQTAQPGSTEPVLVQQTATPFENNYGTVYGKFSRNRTDLLVRVGFYKEGYVDQPVFDRKRSTLELDLSRNLNAALSVHGNAMYSRQKYETLGQKFDDLSATLGLRWNVGRSTSVSVDYTYLDRNADAGSTAYRANEIWLRLAYHGGEGAAVGGM